MRIVVSLLLSLMLAAPALAVKGESKPAPAFKLPSTAGDIKLKDYRGKVVLLDFWASWCGPCRHSFPWMNEMKAKYQSKGLEVVAVSLDMKRENADKFLKKYPAKFTVAYDLEGKVADLYQVSVMPTSYFIDRQGRISEVHYGFRSSQVEELEGKLIKLLAK